jgi:hypothetical protein
MTSKALERLQSVTSRDAAARRTIEIAAARIDVLRAELADAEARFQREADRRAAAEAAVADLEGKLTLAEEELVALRENLSAPGWHWEVHHRDYGSVWFLLDEVGDDIGGVVCTPSRGFEWYVQAEGTDYHRAVTLKEARTALLVAANLRATIPEPAPAALPPPPKGWAWRSPGIDGAWDELICPDGFAVGEVGTARNIHGGFYWRTLIPGLFCATDRTEAGLCVISEAVREYERSGGKPRGESAAESVALSGNPGEGAPPGPRSIPTDPAVASTTPGPLGASASVASPAPDELPELPAGWRWSEREPASPAFSNDLLTSPDGWILGLVKQDGALFRWRQTAKYEGKIIDEGTAVTRRAAGLALLRAAELGRAEQLALESHLPDLASLRASAALPQPPFSATGVQGGSSVQYGAVSHAEAPATRVETQQLDVRPPCTPVQGAFSVRASRRLSARSRCTRSSRLSAGESKGTVGLSARVAKGGPSLTGSGEAEKLPSSPGLEKPECLDGALTSGPGSEKPSRRSLLCDPGGELRIAVPLFGPVELVWWLAVKLAWLVGLLGEHEPGIRWLGIGWHRVDGVEGGALPTYWLGFAPPRGDRSDPEWSVSDGWAWRDHPHGPPEAAGFNYGVVTSGHVVVMAEGDDGAARHRANWGPWFGPRTVVATKPLRWSELAELPDLIRLLRAELEDAERSCPDCALRGDCRNPCEAQRAAAESPDEIAALAAQLTPGIAAAILEHNRAASARLLLEPLTDRERGVLAGDFRETPEPGARAEALAHVIADTARMCDQSAAAVRLGGAGPTELAAERLNEVARILRDGLAAADASAPEPSGDLDLLGSRAEAQAAERALDYPRVALLATELERIVRDVIRDLRDCGGELFPTDGLATDIEAQLRSALHPDQAPADTAAERGE